jgi:hypothetical protein
MRSFANIIGAAAAVLAASGATGQEKAPVARQAQQSPTATAARQGLELLEARLDQAVDSVSLPHAARLMGRVEQARAYRLPGYGVVLVLTPRALPSAQGRVYFLQRAKPRQGKVATQPPPGAPEAIQWTEYEEGVETFERQVLILQHETEAARRAAEEEMDRIVHDVRIRIAPGETPPPPPQAAPAPPAPEPPGAPGQPARPRPAAVPPPPPWKFWFEPGMPAETRTPEAVIADVRTSVVDALVLPEEAFPGLSGDERVTVTVDFVPGGLFAVDARPGRTLVVSVKARDVAARVRGSISVDELRRRVEVSEY